MKLENRTRILVISNAETASVYDAALTANGYMTRSFAYTKEVRRKWIEGHGWQETRHMPSTYMEEILEMVSDFFPHLIILKFEENTFELLVKINQTYSEREEPLILLTVPKDAWFENVDACITTPVDPQVLLQTVEALLQRKPPE